MSHRRIALVVFVVVEATGVAMASAAIVALIYGEGSEAVRIALLSGAVAAVGEVGRRLFGRNGEMSVREGFASVGISWVVMAAVGCLPFLVTGAIPGLTDAFFESASGFTTTGASVVADPAALASSILWWRALTQWMGGMGVIVLAIAVLPLLGTGGVQLDRSEGTGPQSDQLPSRALEAFKRLWLLYVGFTAVEAVLLLLGDMSLFDAVTHSFATMSTGGFGTRAGSLGAYGAYAQWVAVVFMVVAGGSFALHLRGIRHPIEYVRHAEFRFYVGILVVGSALLVVGLLDDGLAEALRTGVFSAVSFVTTTGFTNTDFIGWSAALQLCLIAFMFLGGMAGSTAGGLKTYRLAILTNSGRSDLRRILHPLGVFRTRLGGEPVDDHVVRSAQMFFSFYVLAFLVGTLLLGILQSGVAAGQDLIGSASSVASALGNVGPALGGVGPVSSYAAVPAGGKWLLSALMIVGRLEIFPIILLFTRELWRR